MEKMYLFRTEGYLTTVAVSPDLFEFAIKNGLFGPDSGRDIHRQLLFKEYKENNVYPPFVEFPVVYRQFDGKMFRDMLEMRADGPYFLMSDRMRDIMERNSITGWRSFPITLYDRKGKEIKGYNGFSVIGDGGALIEHTHPEEEILWYQNPKYFKWDIKQWDGTDIFRIKPYKVVVTQKVKDILKINAVQSPCFVPIENRITVIR